MLEGDLMQLLSQARGEARRLGLGQVAELIDDTILTAASSLHEAALAAEIRAGHEREAAGAVRGGRDPRFH
jgi:hypothetical protein